MADVHANDVSNCVLSCSQIRVSDKGGATVDELMKEQDFLFQFWVDLPNLGTSREILRHIAIQHFRVR